MNDQKEITLTDLATEMRSGFTAVRNEISELRDYVRQGFETMDEKIDAVEDKIDGVDERLGGRLTKIEETMLTKIDLDIKFEKIEAGLFTEDEKKSVLDTVKLVNNQLEASVLGKEYITFTRPEYDSASLAKPFPNRFLKSAAVE